MINNLIFIALVVLGVTEIMFVITVILMASKINELNSDYEFFKKILKANDEINDKTISKICEAIDSQNETHEKMFDLIDTMCEQYSAILSSHKDILEAYMIMSNGYKETNGNYKTLLTCWKDVADNYDTACTQFNLCVDELRSFKHILEPWVLDSDDLGQKIVDWERDNSIDNSENPFLEKEVG